MDGNANAEELFETSSRTLFEEFLEAHDALLLAYGSTGSGKVSILKL